MSTQAATATRRAHYDAVLDRALSAIKAAKAVGCTSGTHIRDFLIAGGVPGDWSVNSTNRAVRALIKRGWLVWSHRHRGRRHPGVEIKRVNGFAKAVEAYRTTQAFTARANSSTLQRLVDSYVNPSDDAIQNQSDAAQCIDAIQNQSVAATE